jgi:hypothetical protein
MPTTNGESKAKSNGLQVYPKDDHHHPTNAKENPPREAAGNEAKRCDPRISEPGHS